LTANALTGEVEQAQWAGGLANKALRCNRSR